MTSESKYTPFGWGWGLSLGAVCFFALFSLIKSALSNGLPLFFKMLSLFGKFFSSMPYFGKVICIMIPLVIIVATISAKIMSSTTRRRWH